MSKGFKEWLKISIVLYAIFFFGGFFMNEQDLVIYMLFFLFGLIVFISWHLLVSIVKGIWKTVIIFRDILTTKYEIVWRLNE